jgi:hypothetical protein
MSKMYRVEMFVPCIEVNVYEVEAGSEDEARELAIFSLANHVDQYTADHDDDNVEFFTYQVGGA